MVVEVGKAAIVREVLDQEARCGLFVDPSRANNKPDYGRLDQTWFVKFVRVLGPGIGVSKVGTLFDNVSFIVFNYDRCLEHFLQHAVQDLYSLKFDDAIRVVEKATIIHPYGSIGPLTSIRFGDAELHNYIDLSKNIKTYTEQIEETDTIKRIQQELGLPPEKWSSLK